MITGQTGYHSANAVDPTGDISSALDNLALASTADQSQVDHMMATILQLKETSRILGDQIKELSETNSILARQVQD